MLLRYKHSTLPKQLNTFIVFWGKEKKKRITLSKWVKLCMYSWEGAGWSSIWQHTSLCAASQQWENNPPGLLCHQHDQCNQHLGNPKVKISALPNCSLEYISYSSNALQTIHQHGLYERWFPCLPGNKENMYSIGISDGITGIPSNKFHGSMPALIEKPFPAGLSTETQ